MAVPSPFLTELKSKTTVNLVIFKCMLKDEHERFMLFPIEHILIFLNSSFLWLKLKIEQ